MTLNYLTGDAPRVLMRGRGHHSTLRESRRDQTIMKASSASEHLHSFVIQHNLRERESAAAELSAIAWARESHVVISQAYGDLLESELERLAASGIILHLLHRAEAHLEAAIVAFTSGSGTSSEALSRATVELSSSIQFILQGQPESRVLAYFEDYLAGERKRLSNWLRVIVHISDGARKIHTRAIELRKTGINEMASVVLMLEQSFVTAGVPLRKERWPDVASRFESIDDALGYRTFYGRMSGQVHSDAEETIRYFIARVSDNRDLLKRMEVETTLFSRMMLYFSVSSFMRASSTYARYARMGTAEEVIQHGTSIIDEELHAIAGALENV
jgi:hypothetical protein